MLTRKCCLLFGLSMLFSLAIAVAQTNDLSELNSLREKVKSADTRTRVAAFHRAWNIGYAATDPQVKITALELIGEPIRSSSDHIRMPAMFAATEIATTTEDHNVKLRAMQELQGPLEAVQVPVRIVALECVSRIISSSKDDDVLLAGLQALGDPVKSGNNGVRIPAIAAVVRAARARNNDAAYNAALEMLQQPMSSSAIIGGMELRMFAVAAIERIGLETSSTATKAKAIGMLGRSATKDWEPEAQSRAEEASAAIQKTMKSSS